MLRGAADSELDRAAALKCASLVQRVALLVLPAFWKPEASAAGASSRFLRGWHDINETPRAKRKAPKAGSAPAETTAPKAPHRRGGEGGAFGSGRARAESQWGLGAGAGLFIRAGALLAERAGLSHTQDAKSKNVTGWQITRGIHFCYQTVCVRDP
jgi:hypothetical protein